MVTTSKVMKIVEKKIKLKMFIAMKCSHLKKKRVRIKKSEERGETCARTLIKEW